MNKKAQMDLAREELLLLYLDLSTEKEQAVVRLDWNGQNRKWLVTAYDIDE
jgi:hypothetical protein